jgi:CubicO group peptidase (beta-lactamase class C family)
LPHIAHRVKPTSLSAIRTAVEREIALGRAPGAVVAIGTECGVIDTVPVGRRAILPRSEPMTADTLFDVASLTKVLVTSCATMQLCEHGTLRIDAPAALYWPEFGANVSGAITLRNLLTHYSGLRAVLPTRGWDGYEGSLAYVLRERPQAGPGEHYCYSDINFQVLGEIVQRVSGLQLDRYAREWIFDPVGMRDTGYGVADEDLPRTAPTACEQLCRLRGKVQDEVCRQMGGVSGHAGVFSSGADLMLFARVLLREGRTDHGALLSAASVLAMRTPQSPPGKPRLRGFGWDIAARAEEDATVPRLSAETYGHTGFTGTSLWIDPPSGIAVAILTSRLHPDGRGDIMSLRRSISAILRSAIEAASAPGK